ncbi:MAG: hypothetical protein ACQES4_04435 [Bacillota bacterium]
MQRPVLITAALPFELASFTNLLRKRNVIILDRRGRKTLLSGVLEEGDYSQNVMVLFTGIGRATAEKALLEVLTYVSPKLVLISGTAGALSIQAEVGDIIVDCNKGRKALRDQVLKVTEKVARPGVKVWHKPLHTANQVVTGAGNKICLRQVTKAFTVDMESSGLAEILNKKDVDHVVIRVISDALHDYLSIPLGKYYMADGYPSISRLIGYLLTHPWKIPGLILLGRQFHVKCSGFGYILKEIIKNTVDL